MKVISISTDRKIFEADSAVRKRMLEYGGIFEKLDIIIFSKKNSQFPISNFEISDKVFVYPTNSRNKLFYIIDAFFIIRKLIENSKLKIENYVVTTQDPFETGIVGLLLKLFHKLPLQVQIHTDFANRYFIIHSILNFIRFLLALLVLSFADSVRVVSKRIARSVHALSNHISVLPVYTELRAWSLEFGVQKKENGSMNFLTACRLEKEKDLATAIRAFKKVLDRGIVATFTIVGDGSERKSLELLAKSLEVEDKIHFVGWQNDLEKYYQESDIYLSTSLYEGYGMSVVEAAEYGLPLILSNAGVAGEIFENNKSALIVKPKDIQGFVDAMRRLTEDEGLRKSLGKEAIDSVKRRFLSKEEYLKKYKESLGLAVVHNNNAGAIFKRNILARYLVSGFTAAGTNIGLLYIFTSVFKIWYLYSSVLSFVISIAVSFSLQKLWTFGDKKTKQMHHQFAKYMMVAILGITVNTVLMFVLVDILKIWYILGQIITGGIIAVLNFILYKFFIFQPLSVD